MIMMEGQQSNVQCRFPYCYKYFTDRDAFQAHSMKEHKMILCQTCLRPSFSIDKADQHHLTCSVISPVKRSKRIRIRNQRTILEHQTNVNLESAPNVEQRKGIKNTRARGTTNIEKNELKRTKCEPNSIKEDKENQRTEPSSIESIKENKQNQGTEHSNVHQPQAHVNLFKFKIIDGRICHLCPECEYYNYNYHALLGHVKGHYLKPDRTCFNCKTVFAYPSYLQRHYSKGRHYSKTLMCSLNSVGK